MIYKKRFFLACLVFFTTAVFAQQNSHFSLQNYHPVSPAAFQFTKYDDLPVSTYTGVPDISIPLYEISEDGISIPLSINYHAGGIRVNEEASWVGLGWDLNIGSIVQEINDVDDYDPAVIFSKPDYHWAPFLQYYPSKPAYGICTSPTGINSDWYTPFPLEAIQAKHSYKISREAWMPVNTDFNNQYLGQQIIGGNPVYDSEPDIFVANFLGHSVKFINNKVLNHGANGGGYKVVKNSAGICITTPMGESFYFELSNTTTSNSITGGAGNSSTSPLPSSRIWMLTKIISKNNRQVTLNYTTTAVSANFPGYAEKWNTRTQLVVNTYPESAHESHTEGFPEPNPIGLFQTTSYSSEARSYLTSIVTPKGTIAFTTSNRDDMLGGKKLDLIQVTNSQGDFIRSFQFNYAYFDASTVGGNTYPVNTGTFGTTINKRLKLQSVNDNNGAIHVLGYNSTLLPSKNSLAQDYWGYYNGNLSNVTIAPNAARLKIAGLPDNGSNNSANSAFTQAGILTEIKYPTGGKVKFEYELNQFDNYWVPDFNNINNTVSNGHGLRVKAITYHAYENSTAKKTVYTYTGGKSIQPLKMYRTYNMISTLSQAGGLVSTTFSVQELNGKGFFTTNSLGSMGGIGYDKVTKKEVDQSGNDNGRIEYSFNNNPDIIDNSAAPSSMFEMALPAVKSLILPENGTVISTSYYNKLNALVKKIENSYSVSNSDITYGTKFFGYGNYYYLLPCATQGAPRYWTSVPQNVIGYYPVYGTKTLLTQTTETDYDENNTALVNLKMYGYDLFNNVFSISENPSGAGFTGQVNQKSTRSVYPYDNYPASPASVAFIGKNIFSEVTGSRVINYSLVGGNPQFTDHDILTNSYVVSGNNIVKSTSTFWANLQGGGLPEIVNFSKYDAYANLQEYNQNNTYSALLWDYNAEFVTAECANAAFNDVAATSFEAEGKGNFSFTGTPVSLLSAFTGKKVYSLATGNIQKTNLDINKTYVVSYWSSSGKQNVNGTIAGTGRTAGAFTYYQHIVANPASGTITISGTGTIDELRLYPVSAQLTTYTYTPLKGITSKNDPNNRTTYYEYDASGRLSITRDLDRNITSKVCYNYSGQVVDCSSPCTDFSPDWQNTADPVRCQVGPCGNTGFQEQKQQDMNTCSPTYGQFQWLFLSSPSDCFATNITLNSTNTGNITGYVAVYTNTTTGIVYTFTIPNGTSVLGCVPVGVYNIDIHRSSGMSVILDFTCGITTTTGTSGIFNNINVATKKNNSISINNPF